MARARLLAVSAAAGLCLLAAAPAVAQSPPGNPPGQGQGRNCPNPAGQYPPGQRCTGSTSDSNVPAGQSSQMRIATPPVFIPGEAVSLTVLSTPQSLGTLVAGSSGAVQATVTVPANLEPGAHRLELVGQVSNQLVTIPFTVSGSRAARSSSGLPATGSDSTVPLVASGSAMVLVGSLIVATGRRRRIAGLAA